MTVGNVQFEALDPDWFCEAMEPVSPNIEVNPLRRARFYSKTDAVLLRGVALSRTQCHNFQVRSEPGRGYTSLTLPLSSAVEVVERCGAKSFAPGTAHVLHDNQRFNLKSADAMVLIVNFDHANTQKIASALQLVPADYVDRVELTMASGWACQRQAIRLWSEVQRAGPISRSPLALREAADSLTAQLLMALAAADSGHGPETGRELTRAGVCRAEEYVRANLTEPISRADLCTVSGLNARTLSRGFERRHGMGPMAFVRERRLDHVHRILLAAAPGEVTVTEVALEYGFYHLSRFAADYHRAFGDLPSETLRI